MKNGDARSFALVELMKNKEHTPMGGGYSEGEEEGGDDFMEQAPMHCEKGLEMARSFLDGPEGEDPELRPKVEALASAYEDLLSVLGNNGGEEEEA